MPLSDLSELVIQATERELELQTYPLWLVHYLIAQLQGGTVVPYTELISKIKSSVEPQKNNRSIEDIMREFTPIIEEQRRKEVASNG